MARDLTPAFALGQLSDLEVGVRRLEAVLAEGEARAAAVEAELSAALDRLQALTAKLEATKRRGEAAGKVLAEGNARAAKLHQEVATLQRKSDDLRAAMQAAVEADAQRQIRRQRATLGVQIEDRQTLLGKLTVELEGARATLQAAQRAGVKEGDAVRLQAQELDRLQAKLPSPQTYLRLFEARAGRSHCRWFVDRAPAAWRQEYAVAIGGVESLHGALRAGRYRLDSNSEVVGGRAVATGEALYGLVALGDLVRAQKLFAVATAPTLFFHHIFHVFRVWCVGLYVTGQHRDLAEMLRLHRWSEGLRGAYAEAFLGLLAGDRRLFQRAVKHLVHEEWALWRATAMPSLGVVCVPGLALVRLGVARGLSLPDLGRTVPRELLPP
ncbi:MAG TPA: hypothetical protein VFH51_10785 [Myxococcota bacterium]|nr:hypothetical protein [Myxococcota bacterium]